MARNIPLCKVRDRHGVGCRQTYIAATPEGVQGWLLVDRIVTLQPLLGRDKVHELNTLTQRAEGGIWGVFPAATTTIINKRGERLATVTSKLTWGGSGLVPGGGDPVTSSARQFPISLHLQSKSR